MAHFLLMLVTVSLGALMMHAKHTPDHQFEACCKKIGLTDQCITEKGKKYFKIKEIN